MNNTIKSLRPSGAFIGAAWASLGIGVLAYLIGLWNSSMQLNEKGFYFAVIILGLFSAISLQKTVRDKAEGLPVTGMYFIVCWAGLGLALMLLAVGLYNATFELPTKGFFGMAYLYSLFGVVTVQKNVRDTTAFPTEPKIAESELHSDFAE